jgi:transcription initiation factor IIF auxiliary subunit
VNFFIIQTQKYEGNQWWQWALWIQGSPEDLELVESVTYTLHPTFPQPVRTVTDRGSNFRLQCAGWGVFTIPIAVRLRNGKTVELEHELQFTFPDEVVEDD